MARTASRYQTTRERRWRKSVAGIELRELIGLWEFHNRTENKSPHTVRWYNEALGAFERFLKANGKSLRIDDIGEREARDFVMHLQTKKREDWVRGPNGEGVKLTPEGIQNKIRALKAFFAWLHREGYTEEHRLAHLRNYRVPQRVVDVLSEEEIGRLFKATDMRTDWGARDHAILMVMLDSGLRLSEVIGLRAADLDVEASFLRIMGKGSKERIVPFGAATQKSLWRYYSHYRPQVANDAFFLQLDSRPLTKNSLTLVFKRLAKRAGVPRLHAHLCRHTFATRYLINGGDVFSLQQILGHTTLEMVRRYVNLASAHVAVQHRKFSPMDRFALSRSANAGSPPGPLTKQARGRS